MRFATQAVAALALLGAAIAAPVLAQMPGAEDASRIEAGTYTVDPAHTQVVWKVNHMGITPLYGAFGSPEGTLTLDPAKPSAAKVSLTFPLSGLTVTSPGFFKHLSGTDFFDAAKYPTASFKHLSGTDFFDAAKYPTASFTSTVVVVQGDEAKITGNLTIKGITKPVTIDAEFYGAGNNPQNKQLNIGFKGEANIKRSDFGLGMAVPIVSDEVELEIVAAFVKG